MDAREAFKFGFMSGCIEQGLTSPAEMLQRIKQAGMEGSLGALFALGLGEGAGKVVSEGAGALKDLGGAALEWGVPAAIAAPPLLGYIGGNLAAKATNVDDYDTGDAKRQELIDEYHRQAARLRQQRAVTPLPHNAY